MTSYFRPATVEEQIEGLRHGKYGGCPESAWLLRPSLPMHSYICRDGYEHHVAVNIGSYGSAILEALSVCVPRLPLLPAE